MILLILIFMLVGAFSTYLAGRAIHSRRHIVLKFLLGAILGLVFFFIILFSPKIKDGILEIGWLFAIFCDFIFSAIVSLIILFVFKSKQNDA